MAQIITGQQWFHFWSICVLFINFRMPNSIIIPRFMHHVQFFKEVKFVTFMNMTHVNQTRKLLCCVVNSLWRWWCWSRSVPASKPTPPPATSSTSHTRVLALMSVRCRPVESFVEFILTFWLFIDLFVPNNARVTDSSWLWQQDVI
jgi:hypothetical protein